MIDNEKALEGIKSILDKIEDYELFNLAGTVTQGLLKNKLKTRKGAEEAIIKYSPDVLSILKRKSVTREILFHYAHSHGLNVKLPITKDKLIDKILKHWGSSKECNEYEEERNTDSSSVTVQENETITLPNKTSSTNTVSRRDSASSSEISNSVQIQRTEIDIMAEKFCEWFYNMLNQNSMGMEHFYPDANLKIKLYNGLQLFMEETTDHPSDIVQLLYKTKHEHNLFFNPNLTKEGTKGKMDPHGLVMIMSCGTLHINNTVSGVFEQIFALARDPCSDNNWKIKNTELVLRSKPSVTELPTLCDGELPVRLEIKE